MTPQPLPLDPFVEGDLWDGIPALQIKTGPEGGPFVAPASPLASATMRFIKSGSVPSTPVELSSDNEEEILITDAAAWELSVLQQVVPGLTSGNWDWQIRLIDTDDKPYTYLADTIVVIRKI